MRKYLHLPWSSSGPTLPSRLIALASAALLLSAALQLATAWMQLQTRRALLEYESRLQLQNCGSTVLGGTGETADDWESAYSWEGDDYPPYLPLPLGPPVALTLEDSRHYTLGSSSSYSSINESSTYAKSPAEVAYEWHSSYPGEGLGFVRLGPKKRFFSLALYHQIHCLDSLRKAILAPPTASEGGHAHTRRDTTNEDGKTSVHFANSKRDSAHSSHCLNYLRQTILCAADLTLEPETEEGSQDVGEGLAVTHVCRDWSKVHRFVEGNFEEWWQAGQEQRANASSAHTHRT